MKTHAFICAFACLIVGSLHAETKVAYVDIDKVTGKAKSVSSALSSVGDKVKKYQTDIDTKRRRIKELEEDVRRTEGVLARDEVDKKRKEINKLNNEIDELLLLGRREMQRIDDTFYDPLLKKIVYAIQDVAEEKGIDIVLRGEIVLYGKDTVDITNDVISKLNTDDGSTTRTERKSEAAKTPAEPSKSGTEPAKSTAEPAKPQDTPDTAANTAPAATPESTAKPRSTPKPAGTARPVDRQAE